MKRPPLLSIATEQTAWAAAVLEVVLKDMAGTNSFDKVLKEDVFLSHLLLSVLSEA